MTPNDLEAKALGKARRLDNDLAKVYTERIPQNGRATRPLS